MQFLDDILSNISDWFSGLNHWLQVLITILVVGLVIGMFIYLAISKTKTNDEFSANHKMAIVGIMSSVAFVMMLFKIPYGPTGFLSIELSFLVFYLVAKVVDVRTAIFTMFVTASIHYIVTGSDVGIPLDQSMYFLSSLLFLLPLVFFSKKEIIDNRSLRFIVSLVVSMIFVTVVMTTMNFFITAPIYYELYGLWPYEKGTWPLVFEQETFLGHVVVVYGSFNVVKWSVVGIVTFLAKPALGRVEREFKITG